MVRRFALLSMAVLFSSTGLYAAESVSFAAESSSGPMLHLRTGDVLLDPATSLHKGASDLVTPEGVYVIQLDGPLTPARTDALRSAGIELGSYLPEFAYIVRLPEGFAPAAALKDVGFVRWLGAFDSAWKIDPLIGRGQYSTPQRQAIAAQNDVQLSIVLFDGEDLDEAVANIGAVGGVTVLDVQPAAGQSAMLEVIMPMVSVNHLAGVGAVQWVEEASEKAHRNDSNRWIVQSNVTNSTPVWDRGIRGEDQIGGLIDGALKSTHCSFTAAGKIAAYFGPSGSNGHGTHTSGTFVGNEQPSSGNGFRGIAYAARLVFTNDDILTSVNLATLLTQAHNSGARVHSNSWGDDGTTSYTAWCQSIDSFSYLNEDDLVLFAITNLNVPVKTPENAKNCLAVTLANDSPSQGSQCFSPGRSATADGRRKPEVVAPGCSTMSSNSSTTCGFTSSGYSGTSMACPVVAGTALLARQYFMDGFYPTGTATPENGFTPSGALLKATVINSAVDMTGITGYPSDREGWGRVLLDNALYFAGDARKLIVLEDRRNAEGLVTGEQMTYEVDVTSGTQPLKVTLVWTEKEATINASVAYINNLNLEVVSPASLLYRGNVFSNGASATGGTADARNNVEQVLFNNPSVGRYTITVNAATVNTPAPQGFALVVTGAVETVASILPPTISSITPATGETDEQINITALSGANFQTSGTTDVRLSRPGYSDIEATDVVVVDPSLMTCQFDLAGAEPGNWDVVVVNPDAQVGTLAGGFTVTVTCLKGDLNNDLLVDGVDVSLFVDVLLSGGGTARDRCAGDVEAVGDGAVGLNDVADFVECLLASGCP